MKINKLLERLEYEVVRGSDKTEVTTLANDSRKVEKGSVFVCISGAVSDGHAYIKEVAEKGASAVIIEKDAETPEGLTVIRVKDTRYALAPVSYTHLDVYKRQRDRLSFVSGDMERRSCTALRNPHSKIGRRDGTRADHHLRYGDSQAFR